MADRDEQLLRAILAVNARQTFPPDRLAELIAPDKRKKDRRREAFNMCDGTRSQTEIQRSLKLDGGNFSRTVARWVAAGIVFKIKDGAEERLLYVYPLPENGSKKERD